MSLSKGEKVAVALVLLPAAMVVGTLWFGYVLSTMWGWYMVPLGLRPINWAAASGISGLVSLMRMNAYLKKDENNTVKAAVTHVLSHWLAYAFVLGVGRLMLTWAEWGAK